MALHLINVLVDITRGKRTGSGGQVNSGLPIAERVPGYLREVQAKDEKRMPTSALGSDYELRVASGTDIRTGDIIARMVSAADGITPWPDFLASSDPDHAAGAANVVWSVKYSAERPPSIDSYRPAWLIRRRVGGPDYG